MTVAELIAELKKFPADTIVLIDNDGAPWVPSCVLSMKVAQTDFTPPDVPAPCTVAYVS